MDTAVRVVAHTTTYLLGLDAWAQLDHFPCLYKGVSSHSARPTDQGMGAPVIEVSNNNKSRQEKEKLCL